jgi:RNA polymerase sigma factor (sigma-70 family)
MSSTTLSSVTHGRLTAELEKAFRDHHSMVLRTAFGVTGSREDAQDVLQTVFLRLVSRALPPDLERNPKAYLYRAAVNVSLSLLRQRKRRPSMQLSEQIEIPVAPSDSGMLEERHRLLYDALAEMDAPSAEILILRHVHGMSIPEIAALLGKSRSLIAVRLFRSRARLKKMVLESWSKQS